MAEYSAVILKNGKAVKINSVLKTYSITNLYFDQVGYLLRFDLVVGNANIQYDLFYEDGEPQFFKYDDYLSYKLDSTKFNLNSIKKISYDFFELADTSDVVFTWKRNIDLIDKKYYYKKTTFNWTTSYDFTYEINIPTQADLLPASEKKYEDNPTAISFFTNNFDLCPDKELLVNIAVTIGNIDKEIYRVFDDSDNPPLQEYQNFVTLQRMKLASANFIDEKLKNDSLKTINNPLFNPLFNSEFNFLEAFQTYYKEITDFYQTTLLELRDLETATEVERIASLISSFHPSILSTLSLTQRIEYLKKILEIPITDKILDTVIVRYLIAATTINLPVSQTPSRTYTTKYYRAIINLVSSFEQQYGDSVSERNDFLTFMTSFYNKDSKETYFQIIYNLLVDNVAIDKMIGNLKEDYSLMSLHKKQFIINLYNIWVHSSRYNPYYDIQDELTFPNSEFEQVVNYNYDPDIAPKFINYEASKNFTFLFDNYEFKFKENKIIAKVEDIKPGPFDDGWTLKGTYDIFQPVYLTQQSYEDETFVVIPRISNIQPFNQTDQDNPTNYFLPIFYLKYVDDAGDVQDLLTATELTVDVASTFLGAGVIKNLKYLKYISFTRNLGTVTGVGAELILASASVLSIRISLGLLGLISITAGVCRLAIKYLFEGCIIYRGVIFDNNNQPVEPQPSDYSSNQDYLDAKDNYDDFILCKLIDNWLIAVELFGVAGQIASIYKLQKASQRFIIAFENFSNEKQLAFKDYQLDYVNPNNAISIIKGEDLLGQIRLIALLENQVNAFKTYLLSNNLTQLHAKLLLLTPTDLATFTYNFYRVDAHPTAIINKLQAFENNIIAYPSSSSITYLDNWKFLLDKNIKEYEFFDIITNQIVMDKYRSLFNSQLTPELLLLTSTQRVYLMKNIKYFTSSELTFLNNNPKYIKLLGQARVKKLSVNQYGDKVSNIAADVFEFSNIYNMINVQMSPELAHVLAIRANISTQEAIKNFEDKIQNVDLSLSQIQARFYQGTAGFPELLKGHNRLWVTVKSYDASNTLISSFDEFYISGKQNEVLTAYNNNSNNFPANIKEPNYVIYNEFKQKAIDNKGRHRSDDTEMKLLYNFAETHLNSGASKYVIEIESLFYACTSCRKYLQALIIKGEIENIEIIIIFKSNKKIININTLKEELNIN